MKKLFSYLFAFLLLIIEIAQVNAQAVSCFSGSGSTLNMAGPAYCSGVAYFQNPNGVAVDAAGNVYVADEINNKIRMITPAGVVTTLAGSGSVGSADGVGYLATFNRPTGVAVDASGNVFVADKYNHRIRKITPAGVVTTLAGSSAGYLDGTGTAAMLNAPNGLTLDASGNIYVPERAGHRIRMITSAGVVTTIAGNGSAGYVNATGVNAQFNGPTAIARDASGNLYVADEGNDRIRKITSAGVVTTFAGGGTGAIDGTGTNAVFSSVFGITIDATGNLYVADGGFNLIRKITPGAVVTSFGTLRPAGDVDGLYSVIQMNNPTGVAADANGNLFIADNNNHKIKKINLTAGTCYVFAGNGISGSSDGIGIAASYYLPGGMVYDGSGNLYVSEQGSHVIKKVAPDGSTILFAGGGANGSSGGYADGTGTNVKFDLPNGLAFDAAGNLYVADQGNHKIRKITPAGVVSTLAGSTQGTTDGTGTGAAFYYPTSIAIDATGNLYVADMSNNKIRKVTPAGVVTTFAGSGSPTSSDGTGTAASFYMPTGLYMNANGDLFVTDRGNHKIRKIDAAGVVTTFAGNGVAGGVNGSLMTSSFNNPTGITGDAAGNMYITEYGGHRVRKIDVSGQVTTVAGSATSGYVNANGIAAKFNGPYMILMTPNSELIVSDRLNNRLRAIALPVTSVALSHQSLGEVSLYPNPVRDMLSVETSQEEGSVYILNNVGEVVVEYTLSKDENTFDVSALHRGVYILKIVTDKGYQVQKFIKE